MAQSPSPMFESIVTQMDVADINEILSNWNESELSDDGSEILVYTDSRSDGPRTGGADKVDASEFINWLLSDAPFDTNIYGKDIASDPEWKALIEKARSAANNGGSND